MGVYPLMIPCLLSAPQTTSHEPMSECMHEGEQAGRLKLGKLLKQPVSQEAEGVLWLSSLGARSCH